MKISINTEFWDETDLFEWRKRLDRYSFMLIIFGIAHIIFTRNTNALWLLGLFMFIIGLLSSLSKLQWEKKNDKS